MRPSTYAAEVQHTGLKRSNITAAHDCAMPHPHSCVISHFLLAHKTLTFAVFSVYISTMAPPFLFPEFPFSVWWSWRNQNGTKLLTPQNENQDHCKFVQCHSVPFSLRVNCVSPAAKMFPRCFTEGIFFSFMTPINRVHLRGKKSSTLTILCRALGKTTSANNLYRNGNPFSI